MLSAKTLTVLEGERTTEQLEKGRALDMSEQLGQSDDGVSVSEYEAEKLRSFSEADMRKLVGLGGD